MHGKPKPIGVTPSLTDQRQIIGRERVVPDDCRRICRRIEQRSTGLRRKDFVLLHRRPPGAHPQMVALQFGREFKNQHSCKKSEVQIGEELLISNRPTALNVRFWEDFALTPKAA